VPLGRVPASDGDPRPPLSAAAASAASGAAAAAAAESPLMFASRLEQPFNTTHASKLVAIAATGNETGACAQRDES
jgi:hypothetical protein